MICTYNNKNYIVYDNATMKTARGVTRMSAINNALMYRFIFPIVSDCAHDYKTRNDTRYKKCMKCGHVKKDI